MSGTTAPPPVADRATLEAWLLAAQNARHALMTGRREVIVSYGQGDGQKMVKYNEANLHALTAYIAELQTSLGYRGRRAIGVRF